MLSRMVPDTTFTTEVTFLPKHTNTQKQSLKINLSLLQLVLLLTVVMTAHLEICEDVTSMSSTQE
jgi:hypothetical protein